MLPQGLYGKASAPQSQVVWVFTGEVHSAEGKANQLRAALLILGLRRRGGEGERGRGREGERGRGGEGERGRGGEGERGRGGEERGGEGGEGERGRGRREEGGRLVTLWRIALKMATHHCTDPPLAIKQNLACPFRHMGLLTVLNDRGSDGQ